MKSVPFFLLGGALLLLAGLDQAMERPAKASVPPTRYAYATYSAPSPEIFNRQIGGPALDKPVYVPVSQRRAYPQQSNCNSCQQQYACNSSGYYGDGGTVFYGWNGNGFPIARGTLRVGFRVATFPLRVIGRLFGRC